MEVSCGRVSPAFVSDCFDSDEGEPHAVDSTGPWASS